MVIISTDLIHRACYRSDTIVMCDNKMFLASNNLTVNVYLL